jgi:hypothetical protein
MKDEACEAAAARVPKDEGWNVASWDGGVMGRWSHANDGTVESWDGGVMPMMGQWSHANDGTVESCQ